MSLRAKLDAMGAIPTPQPSGLAQKLAAVESADSPFWQTRRAVDNSEDLQRILDLPRRELTDYNPELLTAFEQKLYRPTASMSLKEFQRYALYEMSLTRGALCPIGVGGGKSLVTLLAPVVLDSRVAVLVVPAPLKRKIFIKDVPLYSKHFRIANVVGADKHHDDVQSSLYVTSYHIIQHPKHYNLLHELRPDLIILDEAHNAKDVSATRTKRIVEYMKLYPETMFVALSGTFTNRSIRDYAHFSKFALGRNSPLPLSKWQLEQWSWALDPSENVAPPGALLQLCEAGEEVRVGFRKRVRATRGVIGTYDSQIPNGMDFHERELRNPPEIEAALKLMRETWTTPSGEEISDPLWFSRYARQLSAGLYTRWIWEGIDPDLKFRWLERRKEWHKEVREACKLNIHGMDSAFLCANAAIQKRYPFYQYFPWKEMEEEFLSSTGLQEPRKETVWVSDFMVRDAVQWGREHVGVIWYYHEALGPAIASLGGFQLFGAGKEASEALLGRTFDYSKTIVVSANAHGEGKDLEVYSKQLVTTPSSNAKRWEQLLGRLHRFGQEADNVESWMYRNTPEMVSAFETALELAEFIEKTDGQRQKLNLATYAFPVRM